MPFVVLRVADVFVTDFQQMTDCVGDWFIDNFRVIKDGVSQPTSFFEQIVLANVAFHIKRVQLRFPNVFRDAITPVFWRMTESGLQWIYGVRGSLNDTWLLGRRIQMFNAVDG